MSEKDALNEMKANLKGAADAANKAGNKGSKGGADDPISQMTNRLYLGTGSSSSSTAKADINEASVNTVTAIYLTPMASMLICAL